MSRKRIVFVIVEGPSDEEALGVILNRIYDKNSVYVHVMHCDITTARGVEPGNIVSKIGNLVRGYAGKIFKAEDFRQIIHITDMDGAFIPDDNIIEDMAEKVPIYFETEIHTCNKAGIVERNRCKRENLNRLVSTRKVWNIPYAIYYMSCNLDHALYGKLNSSDEEKEKDAFHFAERYKADIPAFLKFITKSEFSVMSGYTESWKYIEENLRSLERHTNLGVCLEKIDMDAKAQ